MSFVFCADILLLNRSQSSNTPKYIPVVCGFAPCLDTKYSLMKFGN